MATAYYNDAQPTPHQNTVSKSAITPTRSTPFVNPVQQEAEFKERRLQRLKMQIKGHFPELKIVGTFNPVMDK
jgi:hypothetical protein